jgi:superfamily II DNA or RNA helicase
MPPSSSVAKRARAGALFPAISSVQISDDVRDAMGRLFGPNFRFRSPQQARALMALVRKEGPLVVVLPTGGGKSLLFMVPLILLRAQTTIVVAPFVALVQDLIDRCDRQGLSAVEWTCELAAEGATLVIVSAEHAAGREFLGWATNLQNAGRLDQVVVDECHLVVTAVHYRKRLAQLKNLRNLRCPLAFLTATLPPTLESDFFQAFLLDYAHMIRAPTTRSNISYTVQVLRGRDLVNAAAALRDQLENDWLKDGGDRAIVYCRTRKECSRLASKLGCGQYYSTLPDRAETMKAWIRGDRRWIVATGSLGVGVDVASIRVVVHMGMPYGLVDFAQESGRAGRDGRPALSLVLLNKPAEVPVWNTSEDLVAMHDFLSTTACRRTVLGEYLDGQAMECRVLGTVELCDRCQGGLTVPSRADQQEQEPQQLGFGPVQQATRREQRALDTLKAKLDWAKGCCPFCLVLDEEAAARGHAFGGCRFHDGLTKDTYIKFKRAIQFDGYSCCFTCAAPQEHCTAQGNWRVCKYLDVILPACLAWWRSESLEGQRWSPSLPKPCPTTEEEFARWLGLSTQWNNVGVTYAAVLFDFFCVEGPQ